MLSRSFFPSFGQGLFPKIAGKGPDGSAAFKTNIRAYMHEVNARNHDEAAHNERSHMGLSPAIRGD